MTRRPNPKFLTPAQRIASVDFELRQLLIDENRTRGMKHLAKDYDLPEKTVRAIIHDAKLQPPSIVAKPKLPDHTNLWERPDLWHRYGINGPCTPRMVEVT